MELMAGGTLAEQLPKISLVTSARNAVGEGLLGHIAWEVAAGIAYLHWNGCMHRNARAANVLLDLLMHAYARNAGASADPPDKPFVVGVCSSEIDYPNNLAETLLDVTVGGHGHNIVTPRVRDALLKKLLQRNRGTAEGAV